MIALLVEVTLWIFVTAGFAGLPTLFRKQPSPLLGISFLHFLYALLRWAAVTPGLALGILAVISVIGIFALATRACEKRELITALLVSGAFYFAGYLTRTNIWAVDLRHYSWDAAMAFRESTFLVNVPEVAQGRIRYIIDLMLQSRTGTTALPWLSGAIGISIDLGTIHRATSFLAGLLCSVIFRYFTRLGFGHWVAILLLGSLPWIHTFQALFVGGQINQILGLVALLSAIEFMLNRPNAPLTKADYLWSGIGLCSIPTFYPEIILVAPLAVITAWTLEPSFRIRDIPKAALLASLPSLAILVVRLSDLKAFYLGQVGAVVTWDPFSNISWTWAQIPFLLLTGWKIPGPWNNSWVVLIVFLFLFAIFLWRKKPNFSTLYHFRFAFLTTVWTLLVVYLSLSNTKNPQYSCFKLAGWLTPFLQLTLWQGAISASKKIARNKILPWMAFASMALMVFSSKFIISAAVIHQQRQTLPEFASPNEEPLALQSIEDSAWTRKLAPHHNQKLLIQETPK